MRAKVQPCCKHCADLRDTVTKLKTVVSRLLALALTNATLTNKYLDLKKLPNLRNK